MNKTNKQTSTEFPEGGKAVSTKESPAYQWGDLYFKTGLKSEYLKRGSQKKCITVPPLWHTEAICICGRLKDTYTQMS